MIGAIQIELTPEDALLFREFRRVQNTLAILTEAGVFNIHNGKAILNFDPAGILTEVKFDVTVYKAGHVVIPISKT